MLWIVKSSSLYFVFSLVLIEVAACCFPDERLIWFASKWLLAEVSSTMNKDELSFGDFGVPWVSFFSLVFRVQQINSETVFWYVEIEFSLWSKSKEHCQMPDKFNRFHAQVTVILPSASEMFYFQGGKKTCYLMLF